MLDFAVTILNLSALIFLLGLTVTSFVATLTYYFWSATATVVQEYKGEGIGNESLESFVTTYTLILPAPLFVFIRTLNLMYEPYKEALRVQQVSVLALVTAGCFLVSYVLVHYCIRKMITFFYPSAVFQSRYPANIKSLGERKVFEKKGTQWLNRMM
jgi:tetrahydromethanopterin S-methyltransferase subunit D